MAGEMEQKYFDAILDALLDIRKILETAHGISVTRNEVDDDRPTISGLS